MEASVLNGCFGGTLQPFAWDRVSIGRRKAAPFRRSIAFVEAHQTFPLKPTADRVRLKAAAVPFPWACRTEYSYALSHFQSCRPFRSEMSDRSIGRQIFAVKTLNMPVQMAILVHGGPDDLSA